MNRIFMFAVLHVLKVLLVYPNATKGQINAALTSIARAEEHI